MFDNLPTQAQAAFDWTWDDYAPYFDDLQQRDLNEDTLEPWLADWSKLTSILYEVGSRLYVATTVDTKDKTSRDLFFAFLENISEASEEAGTTLSRKLLESGLQPQNFDVQLRMMRAQVEQFREENLPLQTQLEKLGKTYDEISGAQTVEWEGEQKTLVQMGVIQLDSDRDKREAAWRAATTRGLQDREQLNDLWIEMLKLRLEIARNADKDDFRDYQWIQHGRFDYTPDDVHEFLDAIEQVVVPAQLRLQERRKQALGLDALRPWDLAVDPISPQPLKPFDDVSDLIAGGRRIFEQIDPDLAGYYATMQDDQLLDLDNRPNKAPGGYCTNFAVAKRPFIFMNAVGVHRNVQTLLHECGHAFHNFESYALPYIYQRMAPTEFAEVASMAMELLAQPYLEADHGGYYSDFDANRARIEKLSSIIEFYPYMAVVVAFQHWVYTHPNDAIDPANCDAQWNDLWDKYMPGVDWTGLEDVKVTGWHRKLHIFLLPFYYIEYGLAQLGAMQVWRNAMTDPAGALKQYRGALALGGTRKLPDLFEAAGAKLAFDAVTLGDSIALVEQTLDQYRAQLN